MIVVAEILKLCRERNYFMRYKNGDNNRSLSLKLLPETIDALAETGFIKLNGKEKKSNTINMSVDPVVAKKMEEFIDTHPKMSLLDLTQVLMLYSGKFLMKPINSTANYQKLPSFAPDKNKDKNWDKSIENWLIS